MSLSLIESSKGYLEFFGIKFSIDNSRLNQLVFDILTTKKTAPHHSMEEHTKQAMNQRGFEYNRSILILILFVYVQIYLQLPFELIHQSPKDGADNKIIAFLHPKSTDGILVELCQEKN